MSSRPATVPVGTVPVLAVLVCHDGEPWLRQALPALRRQSSRPRHVVAVDTGSADRTAELLGAASSGEQAVLDAVLPAPATTGFGDAVGMALEYAVERWGDPGGWLWLLHDDCAPEPGCLRALLDAAELSPSAGVLGPLALDWSDPRLVVEAGLSTDAGGHRQTGIGAHELDWGRFGGGDGGDPSGGRCRQAIEVLAVPSAAALVRRELWEELGGYDPALPLLRDDLDFGWRVNRAGRLVLCVPEARTRHARATGTGLRRPGALRGTPRATADRAHGVRTFLVNCGRPAFVVGLPRLLLLCLLRGTWFLLLRRAHAAAAEFGAAGYLLTGRAGLRAGRRARGPGGPGTVSGLLTSRLTRLRNAVGGGIAGMVRRRVAAEAALGRLPEEGTHRAVWVPPGAAAWPRLRSGPESLPAGALRSRPRGGRRRPAGLRRPAGAVVVPLPPEAAAPADGGARSRPSPRPQPRHGGLLLVEYGRLRMLAELLLAPPLLLFVLLSAVSVVSNLGRLGVHLAGGRLLPLPSLGGIWSAYLANWHGVAGGTSAPAPAALAVLGVLGAPFHSPSTAAAVLLLGDAPIAGLLAYAATRRLRVRRWVRALAAGGYALLPPATAAVAQGRLDTVVAHLLLPPVLAGVVAVLVPTVGRRGRASWLSGTVLTALGLAVVGAFSPVVYLLVLALVLVGFVLVATPPGEAARRVVSLFALVLLPLALLLPWPAAVVAHPALVLFGVGATVPATDVTPAQLVALAPGGPGSWPYVGLVVVVAALLAAVVRPRRAMLPGLGVVMLGGAATAALAVLTAVPLTGGAPRHAFTGPTLLVAGAGMVWLVLAGCEWTRRAERPGSRPVAVLAAAGAVGVLALAAGDLIAGGAGPLRAAPEPVLAGAQAAELARSGQSVLLLAHDGAPTRQIAGRTARFGDDAVATPDGATARLRRWDTALRVGGRDAVLTAVAQATASGVAMVVLPDQRVADRLRQVAGDLVAPLPDTADGRPVLRLRSAAGAVTLYSPELSQRAANGGDPPATPRTQGVSAVAAAPPEVAVRVSAGARGRLLVVAANDEAAWRATVGDRQAPIITSWGHLVGVEVPAAGGDVRIYQLTTLREVLLLVQAAALLFTLLTAVPTGGARAEPAPARPPRPIPSPSPRAQRGTCTHDGGKSHFQQR